MTKVTGKKSFTVRCISFKCRENFCCFTSSVLKVLKKAIAQTIQWENLRNSAKTVKLFSHVTYDMLLCKDMYKFNFYDSTRHTFSYMLHAYRILGNFRGKIISLFSRIFLKPRKFNYTNIFSQNFSYL